MADADDVARPSGVDVYEEEEDVFYRDLSADVLHDDMLTRLMVRSPGPRIIALDVPERGLACDRPILTPIGLRLLMAAAPNPPLLAADAAARRRPPTQAFPNVILTPHEGFYTIEALVRIATVTLENITKYQSVSTHSRTWYDPCGVRAIDGWFQ